MSFDVSRSGLVVVVAGVVVAGFSLCFGVTAAASDAASGSCGVRGYSYAGVQDARVAHGIRATLTLLAQPQVEDGHVAAWVGVGGPGEGSGGSDAWIQIGLSAFLDGVSHLYFEVDQPGTGPRYTELASTLPVGARYQVAVLEVGSRPGWWRVWLNGAPDSDPVYLAGSSGRWRPMAIAETWDGGRPVCNRFAYRFERVAIAAAPGGAWKPFVTGDRFEDPGYRVRLLTQTAFLASST